MADEIKVTGLDELNRYLQELPVKMERNVLRGALRQAANVIKPVAAANIHNVSGELAKSLKVRTGSKGGKVTAHVYTRVFYAPLVEYKGAAPHTIKPKNKRALVINGQVFRWAQHPGMKPHPFMRPALDTMAQAAVIAAGNYIKVRLETKHGIDTADINVEAA